MIKNPNEIPTIYFNKNLILKCLMIFFELFAIDNKK